MTNPLALARPSYLGQGPSRKEEEQGEELEALSAAITAAYTAQRVWLEEHGYTPFVKGYYENQRSYWVHPLYLSLWQNQGEALLYNQETPSWAVVVI